METKKKGRKPKNPESKVKAITFYLAPEVIEELGGTKEVKRLAKDFLKSIASG